MRNLSRILALSVLAALGLMAFVATSAQASGSVKILGKELTATFAGTQESLGVFLIGKLKLDIQCHAGKLVNGSITNASTGTGTAKVLFEECLVLIDKADLPQLPIAPDCIIELEKHITANANLLVILHTNGGAYVVATGSGAGELFTEIHFKQPSECVIGTKLVKVTGKLAFEVLAGDLTGGGSAVKDILIDASEAIQKLIGSKLQFGINESFVTGSGTTPLIGEHANCTWGVS